MMIMFTLKVGNHSMKTRFMNERFDAGNFQTKGNCRGSVIVHIQLEDIY